MDGALFGCAGRGRILSRPPCLPHVIVAVDTAFVMVDDNSPTHIQFAWLTPNGHLGNAVDEVIMSIAGHALRAMLSGPKRIQWP